MMKEINDLKQGGVTAKGTLNKCMISFRLSNLNRMTLYEFCSDFKQRLQKRKIGFTVEYTTCWNRGNQLTIKPVLQCMEWQYVSINHTFIYTFRDEIELSEYKDFVVAQERKEAIDEILTDLEENPVD